MSDFISRCACRGRKPRHIADLDLSYRNELLSRLMRDRRTVRLVQAPPFFGKTCLAATYAQAVFSFEETFWVDGTSPCFLRDLDLDVLKDSLCDRRGLGEALAVFEDVPALDERRLAIFWKTCCGLVSEGWEVLVTSTSRAAPLSGHESDCVCLGASDLLYRNDEVALMRARNPHARTLVNPRHAMQRVAGLVPWNEGNEELFLQAIIAEADDARELAALFAILMLQCGTFDRLAEIFSCEARLVPRPRFDDGLYLGFDPVADAFDATGLPFSLVVRAFIPYLQHMADAAGASDVVSFLILIADALVEDGAVERAVGMLHETLDADARLAWAVSHFPHLMETGTLFPLLTFCAGLGGDRIGTEPALQVALAMGRCLLGEGQPGEDALASLARSPHADAADRAMAALVFAVLARDGSSVKSSALLTMPVFRSTSRAGEHCWEDRAAGLALLQGMEDDCVMTSEELLKWAAGHKSPQRAAWLLSAWMCFAESGASSPGFAAAAEQRKEAIGATVAAVLAHIAANQVPSTSALVLMRAYERFASRVGIASPLFTEEAQRRRETMVRGLHAQSELYARWRARREAAGVGAFATLAQTAARQGGGCVRQVHVEVFGGLRMKVDGEPFDFSLLPRRKARALLGVLTAYAGRELSCDYLAAQLWPDSEQNRAQRNFYCIWSVLRRAMADQGGERDVLRRRHGSCSLDRAVVTSDIDELDELCRLMLLEADRIDDPLDILDRFREIYRGDLMPGMNSVECLNGARVHWRKRAGDALVMAARTLSDAGEFASSVQYAQHAVQVDDGREDVYDTLMRCQMAAGDRSGAVRTWLEYCDFMQLKLGLDPSPRTAELYRQIIEGDSCSTAD